MSSLRLAGVVFGQLGHAHDVVAHAHAAEDRVLLRQVADAEPRALVHRQRGDVRAVDRDAARIGRDQAHDHVEAGGLARAVGTQQADDLAAAQVQADVLHHLAALERLGEVDRPQTVALVDRPGSTDELSVRASMNLSQFGRGAGVGGRRGAAGWSVWLGRREDGEHALVVRR